MNIYIVRHCSATGQQADAQLTEEGRGQARKLKDFLNSYSIKKVVSSPFARAVHSIQPFADENELAVTTDDRLKERVLSVKNESDWKEKLKSAFFEKNKRFEGGESSIEASDRIVSVVNGLRKEGSDAVIVTHGNLMSLLINHYDDTFGYEEWEQLTNPDVYELSFINKGVNLRRIWDEKK